MFKIVNRLRHDNFCARLRVGYLERQIMSTCCGLGRLTLRRRLAEFGGLCLTKLPKLCKNIKHTNNLKTRKKESYYNNLIIVLSKI